VRRGQRQVEQVKIKMGMQMDGEAFRATLLETQVGHLRLWAPVDTNTFPGHVNQGPHEVELRFAPGSHRRPTIEPKEDGRSHQSVKVHQTFDHVLSSFQLQVFGPSTDKGKGPIMIAAKRHSGSPRRETRNGSGSGAQCSLHCLRVRKA